MRNLRQGSDVNDLHRTLAAICRADADEFDEHEPENQKWLAEMAQPKNEPHFMVYQAAAEHRKLSSYLAQRKYESAYLRELARCLEKGSPSRSLEKLAGQKQ